MAVTTVAEVVVPEIFSPYIQQITEEKSNIIQSGAFVVDPMLNQVLSGGGLTFNEPSFRDLENSDDNVSSDDPSVFSTPFNILTSNEIQVRLSRNNSWSSMDLAADLAGADPAAAIGARVGYYWTRRHQAAAIATMKGVFANNAAAPIAGEHVQGDMTHDASGAAFVDGQTNFSLRNYFNALSTMGDSGYEISLIMAHSIVFYGAAFQDRVEYRPMAELSGALAPYFYRPQGIPTYNGAVVVVDDAMPFTGGVAETWLFSSGAVRVGMGSPKVPTAVERKEDAGNGGGQETLYNRHEWIIHPVGYQYAGTPANGGPNNSATANNLAAATSWKRVYPERKQIRIARLITRES